MLNNQSIGKLGEDLATEYMRQRGCRIIERNFRKPWGEIDVIVQDKKKTLIFLEVKTIRSYAGTAKENLIIQPEDNLTRSKLKKLQRTASFYVGYNENLINEKRGWRIDLIAIIIPDEIIPPTSD